MGASDILSKISESNLINKKMLVIEIAIMKIYIYWIRISTSDKEPILTKRTKHSSFEMEYCLSGSFDIKCGDRVLKLNGSQFTFVPPYTFHEINNVSSYCEKFIMSFNIETVNARVQKFLSKISEGFVEDDNDFIQTLILLMSKTIGSNKSFSDDILKNIVVCLIYELINQTCPEPDISDLLTDGGEDETVSKNIENYIKKHQGIGISVVDLASNIHFSTRHLGRICQRYFYRNPRQLIDYEKLKYVKYLIQNTNFSISEIAELTNYSNGYSLNKFFRKYENMTINEYRKLINLN